MGLEAELEYQANRARTIGDLSPIPRHVIERYRHTRMWRLLPKEYMFKRLREEGAFAGKKVLDFGSGEGVVSSQLAALGAHVTGVDISPELIELARRQARLDGVASRTEFVVADITRAPLPRDHFDFVVCEAVLHHVDVYTFVPALVAALKPGGMMLVQEPRALPGALRRLRDVVPVEKDASPDERPLDDDEFSFLAGALTNVEIRHFHVMSRLTRLLPNVNRIDKGHPYTKAAVMALTGIDRLLLSLPGMQRFAGIAVLTGRKPEPATQPGDSEVTVPRKAA